MSVLLYNRVMKDSRSNRYRRLSTALVEMYGQKVYKLPLSLAGTCPNRDGSLGRGGCVMCAGSGIDFELLDATVPLEVQLDRNMHYIAKKYKAERFIAYFQNYTTTYLPTEAVLALLEKVHRPDIVEIALSARPDCVPDELLLALRQVQERTSQTIVLELGVQILNDVVLEHMQRGHDSASSIDAIRRIKAHGLSACAHVMLNYPGVTREDIMHTARVLGELGVDRIKCHSLYIQEGTRLAEYYEQKRFEIAPADDYMERVMLFLRYLPKHVIIERLFARAPKKNTLFCNWGRSWRFLQNELERKMEITDIHQGDLL